VSSPIERQMTCLGGDDCKSVKVGVLIFDAPDFMAQPPNPFSAFKESHLTGKHRQRDHLTERIYFALASGDAVGDNSY
jgi:hypothetical protein